MTPGVGMHLDFPGGFRGFGVSGFLRFGEKMLNLIRGSLR